jgi:hypothetical protein
MNMFTYEPVKYRGRVDCPDVNGTGDVTIHRKVYSLFEDELNKTEASLGRDHNYML